MSDSHINYAAIIASTVYVGVSLTMICALILLSRYCTEDVSRDRVDTLDITEDCRRNASGFFTGCEDEETDDGNCEYNTYSLEEDDEERLCCCC